MAVPDDAKAADAKKKEGVKKGGKDAPVVEELSEEDLALKQNLELIVERVQDPDAGVQALALASITKEIHTATSSMTSVPKPLKFLRAHYDTLRARFDTLPAGPNKAQLADIISVLASTTQAKEGERDALKYKLLGDRNNLDTWGHEYLRHVAGEISKEYQVGRRIGAHAGARARLGGAAALSALRGQGHAAAPAAAAAAVDL